MSTVNIQALVATKLSEKVLRVFYWFEAPMFVDLPAEHCFRVDLTDLISRGNHSHFSPFRLSLPLLQVYFFFVFLFHELVAMKLCGQE